MIKQVTITDRPAWGKWPHTQDTDYSDILAQRNILKYGDIEVEERFYPAYYPYVKTGILATPQPPSVIDNTTPPDPRVTDQQLQDITQLSKECQVMYWHTAYQCYPCVANHIPSMFPLRIIAFGDDCPGSSEQKMFPIAHNFNALIHAMGVWSMKTGQKVADMYKAMGIARMYQITAGMTTGLSIAMEDSGFSLDRRIQQLRDNQHIFPYDLILSKKVGATRYYSLQSM